MMVNTWDSSIDIYQAPFGYSAARRLILIGGRRMSSLLSSLNADLGHIYTTVGDYVTKSWAIPDTKPTLTLPLKGAYVCIINFSGINKFTTKYAQFSIHSVSGELFRFTQSLTMQGWTHNIVSLGVSGIIKTSAENITVFPYMHVPDAGITLSASLCCVYVGGKNN